MCWQCVVTGKAETSQVLRILRISSLSLSLSLSLRLAGELSAPSLLFAEQDHHQSISEED